MEQFEYKICPVCKKVFKRDKRNSHGQFKFRKYCSQECIKSKSITKPVAPKNKSYADYLTDWKKSPLYY